VGETEDSDGREVLVFEFDDPLDAMRRYLRIAQADNDREAAAVTLEWIERDLRRRFVEEDPAAPVEAIEARVAAVIERGSRPSTPPPRSAPEQPMAGMQALAWEAARMAGNGRGGRPGSADPRGRGALSRG
jgi:hypothetical protein